MIHFDNYLFFSLLILIALISSFFYISKQHASISLKWVLGFLRFSVLALTLLLLLSPILKCNKTKSVKPKIMVLCDNSMSIKNILTSDYSKELKGLRSILENENVELEFKIFDSKLENIDSLNLKGRRTDIFTALQNVFSTNTDKNLHRLILVTDGNYNEGNNPVFVQNSSLIPIDVVLLGDTSKVRDIKIENLEYNSIMLQDEINTLRVLVSAQSFENSQAIVDLEEIVSNGTKKIAQSKLNINSNKYNHSLEFKLSELSKGKHNFRIRLRSDVNELNIENNDKVFTVEVVDGEKQIEIISNFPHPDISALKSWIEINKNCKVKLNIADGISTISDKSDLVIFYQIPNSINNGKGLFDIAKLSGKSVLFVLGTKTDYSAFNTLQKCYKINLKGNLIQDYSPKMNTNFSKFYLNESSMNSFFSYPPLSNYLISIESLGEFSHLFWSRLGTIETEQPLISFSSQDNIQIGLIAGENIWKWRINNYQQKKNFIESQELIDKLTNYLAIKKDKKQLTTFLSREHIVEGDKLIITANTYNELYQPKKAEAIKCMINGGNFKNQTFEMLAFENGYTLAPNYLAAGSYNYEVQATIGGKVFKDFGKFIVHEDNIESMYLPSNYEDMHALTQKTGGNLLMWKDRGKLGQNILSNDFKAKLANEVSRFRANDIIYLLLLLLIILSIEWLIRKYFGLI